MLASTSATAPGNGYLRSDAIEWPSTRAGIPPDPEHGSARRLDCLLEPGIGDQEPVELRVQALSHHHVPGVEIPDQDIVGLFARPVATDRDAARECHGVLAGQMVKLPVEPRVVRELEDRIQPADVDVLLVPEEER